MTKKKDLLRMKNREKKTEELLMRQKVENYEVR
jgi:hypothetical protein